MSAGPSTPTGNGGDGRHGDSAGPAGEREPLGATARRGLGRTTLKLPLRGDLARWWHALKAAHGRSGLGGPFMSWLCGAVWRAWHHTLETDVKYGDIYRRDQWRCASPVCDRRDVTPHHLRFRSRGGGEEPENLVTLCSTCHLDLVHGGMMRAEPPASHITWLLGQVPVIEVNGRERVRCAGP